MRHTARHGTVLIIVAGISALLAALSMTFLARMRSEAQEMQTVMREAQARIMLMAACNYIQESSRIGHASTGIGTAGNNLETFGWIDVRDNTIGPKFYARPGDGDNDQIFPIGSFRRCPMYMLEQPPYAIQQTVSYNPIRTPISPDPAPYGSADFGRPYLRYPDPQPVTNNYWAPPSGVSVKADRFTEWEEGKKTPVPHSTSLSWFRLYRESGATFVVTCGGGGTQGYRNWSEIPHDERGEFGDITVFETLLADEVRLWYRVEWSAAVMTMDYHMLDHSLGRGFDHYMVWPINASHSTAGHEYRTQTHARNMGGTIRWVQRLITEPTNW